MDLKKYLMNLCDFPAVPLERYFRRLRIHLYSAKFEYDYDNDDSIINMLYEFKQICLDYLKSEEFKQEKVKLKGILASNSVSNDFILKEIKRFKNLIFSNRSFILLTNDKSQDSFLFHQNNLCRFIIVKDYHFSGDSEKILKKNGFDKKYEITNEFLKLERLKELIKNTIKEDLFQSDEITLNINQIKKLSLRYRNIENIDSFAFEGFDQLEILNLDNNKITFLDSYLFKSLINLKELDLSFNFISIIDETMFQSLKKLTFVNLASNDLYELPRFAFSNLKHLDTVVLSDNPRLQEESFYNQTKRVKFFTKI